MKWQDNIVEWTGLRLEEAILRTKNKEGWKKIVNKSTLPLRRIRPYRAYGIQMLWESHNGIGKR